MNFQFAFVILFVAIIHCNYGAAQQFNPRCNRACPQQYNPVCATLIRRNGKAIRCTFRNPCLLNQRRCLTTETWAATIGRCFIKSIECSWITNV